MTATDVGEFAARVPAEPWSVSEAAVDEMWRMALRAQPHEAGGVVYGSHVVWLANRAHDNLHAYTPDDIALKAVLERFGRLPDATWHSHQRSPDLSEGDRASLRLWPTAHVIVDVNGNHKTHRYDEGEMQWKTT